MDINNALVQLKSPDGFLYAGLPKFRALFGRDSIISAIALLDLDSTIAMNTLISLASSQGTEFNSETAEEPGKIIHEVQSDPEFIRKRINVVPWIRTGRNYFSIDSTSLFVMLYERFVSKNEIRIDHKLSESAVRAIRWIVDSGIREKYISYMKNHIMSQSWRDGSGFILDSMKEPVSTIGVQSYGYIALTKGISALERSSYEIEPGMKSDAMIRAGAIKESLNSDFFIEETGYYALAIDGDGVAQTAETTDPGHLLLSGMLSRKQERLIIDRLMEPDILTEYGMRCISSRSPFFDQKAYQRGSVWPHDNLMIVMGMDARGYSRESREIKERLISAMEKIGGFPEYFGVSRDGNLMKTKDMRIAACDPQAWTVGTYHYCLA